MLVELHMLKNYAPSNLNRDDTGSPKSCVFGGVNRGRISSQCQKRALRQSSLLRDAIDDSLFGIRTRKLPQLIAESLRKQGVDEEYVKIAQQKITGFGNRDGKENKDEFLTPQIIFFSQSDIDAVVECIKKAVDEAGTLKKFEGLNAKDLQKKMRDSSRPITLDIALFGRMVTSDAFRNVDAAMQVAHAISTNQLESRFDFFTAVDDLLDSDEETGAGMMGDVEFNSNCYYMYASLDLGQLMSNLQGIEDIKEVVIKAVPSILRAFAYSNPSGKQNTFAAHQLPSVVYVETKDEKVPISYANAFEKPASPTREHGLVESSISKLKEEIDKVTKHFDLNVKHRLWLCTESKVAQPPAGAEGFDSLKGLNNKVADLVRGAI